MPSFTTPIERSEYSVYGTLPNDEYVLRHNNGYAEPLTVWARAEESTSIALGINGARYEFSRIVFDSDLRAMTRVPQESHAG